MFIVGNLLIALARVIDLILNLIFWLIFLRALISWVNPDPFNAIVQFLYRTTEPILQPIRKYFPRMGLDFSPMIAILIIIFIQSFLIASLKGAGFRMQESRRLYAPNSIKGISPKEDATFQQEYKLH